MYNVPMLKRWQFWLGVLISIVFLYFSLRGLQLDEFWQTITAADYGWLIPGVAVYFIGLWARSWRWHYLLRPLKKIATTAMFPIVAIGYMGNNIYPARAGEVLRAAVLKQREGVPISASLATIIVERVFDGVVMLAFVFLNLPELANLTAASGFLGSIQQVAIWGSAAFLGALALFLLAAMFPRITERLANWLIDRLVPSRWREGGRGIALRFLTGLESLRSPRDALMVFLTTVVIWLLETGKYWFIMHAFPFEVSFFALMLMNGIVNLTTTLPSAPGYVGTFDAPGIALLQAYGVPAEVAAGYTLVLHAALWFPVTMLGLYYYLRQPLRWGKDLEKMRRTSPAGSVPASTNPRRVAIIGAGYGGMAAAYDLSRAGHSVTIFEGADGVGGLAAGFKEPHWDWSVERYYHHWFQSDRHMLGLMDELGLRGKVIFPRPFTVIFWEGKFYPFDSITSNIPAFILRRFPFLDAVRYGLSGAYLRFSPRWKPLEKATANDWTRRWFGPRVHSLQWQPLLESKFGSRFFTQVNMAWLWARLHSRTTRLGTYQGGFQAFSDDFAAILHRMGVTIELSTPVTRITSLPQGGLELTAAGKVQVFDQVLVTTSPGQLAQLAPQLPGDYLRGLLSLKHMGAVVMVVSLKHQLSTDGYYWFNLPKSAGFPFLALVEHTNYLPASHFGGDHLIYMGDYLETDHEHFRLSQEELLQRFLPALQRINPAFRPDWVNKSWLWRTTYAQPVPLINHSANIPPIRTPLPGLYFASMSQVYPWDRGTNFAVEIGRRAAGLMQDEIPNLARAPRTPAE